MNTRSTVTPSGISLSPSSANFVAGLSNQFVIVSNDGRDGVIGTFNGLAENASLYVGDQIFRMIYTGGDGNDVVLTKIGDVFRPTLSIERVPPTSVQLLWRLQSNTNLATTNWTPVLPAPVIVGAQYAVTNSAGGAQRSYRLLKP